MYLKPKHWTTQRRPGRLTVAYDKKNGMGRYGLLAVAVVLYSCVSICSKLASGYPVLSWGFILRYGASIFLLMVYAVLWQQVLKRFALSVAYAAKPASTILTMAAGIVLFQEQIKWNMLLGAVLILLGIHLAVKEHED